MSTPLHAMLTNTFVSDGTAFPLVLPSDVQEFKLYNLSSLGLSDASVPIMIAKWALNMPDGAAIRGIKVTNESDIEWDSIASAGFTHIADSGDLSPGPLLAQTATTNADPIVVSTANTASLAVGDVVRIIDNTGAQQITGIDYTVTAITAGVSFSLGFAGQAPGSAGTAGFFRRIPFQPPFYPRNRTITNITAAANAVITLSVTHQLTAGQRIRLRVPQGWGMVEADGLEATILSINVGANTITVDLNTAGFTAFTYPSSAQAADGVGQAQVIPFGMTAADPWANDLSGATFNTTFRGIIVGTGVQTTGETYRWFAKRGVTI